MGKVKEKMMEEQETTPTQPQWEIEFEKYTDMDNNNRFACVDYAYKIKKLISSLLLSEKSRLLQQIKDIVPKEKKTCTCMEDDDLGFHTKECDMTLIGWNSCREQMLSELKKII